MSMDYQYYDGADVAKVKLTYGYYRQPNGWITASPATNTDELRYRRDGWEPLPQYGRFEMGTPYMSSHRFEPLFMRGGAHEFCVEQIRQEGMYINPPKIPTCGKALDQNHRRHQGCFVNAKSVVFPQLASVAIEGPFPCSFGCGRNDLPTEAARQQHESVMHAPEKSDERTGKSLAEALIAGFGGQSPAPPVMAPGVQEDAMAALLRQLASMQAEIASLKARPVPAAPRRRRGPNKPKVAVPA